MPFDFKDVLPLIVGLSVSEIKNYINKKYIQKNHKKLLNQPGESIYFYDNKMIYLDFIFYSISTILLLVTLYSFAKDGLKHNLALPLTYGFSLMFLPKRIRNNMKIVVGEYGFYSRGFAIEWKDIEKIVWDNDVKQTNWGVKFFSLGVKSPLKFYISRKYKNEFEKLINQYFTEFQSNSLK